MQIREKEIRFEIGASGTRHGIDAVPIIGVFNGTEGTSIPSSEAIVGAVSHAHQLDQPIVHFNLGGSEGYKATVRRLGEGTNGYYDVVVSPHFLTKSVGK